jgi:hypothetical protein
MAAVAQSGGFPVRWSIVIGAILWWNGALLLGGWPSAQGFPAEPMLIAGLPVLALALSALRSPAVQKAVLQEGHSVEQIAAFLRLLILVLGIFCAVSIVVLLSEATKNAA